MCCCRSPIFPSKNATPNWNATIQRAHEMNTFHTIALEAGGRTNVMFMLGKSLDCSDLEVGVYPAGEHFGWLYAS